MGTFRNLKRLMGGDVPDEEGVPQPMLGPSQYGIPEPRAPQDGLVRVVDQDTGEVQYGTRLGDGAQPAPPVPAEPKHGLFALAGADALPGLGAPVAVKPKRAPQRAAPVDTSDMDPALAKAVAGLGGVADRAQAQMEGDTPTPGSGTRMAGAMSGAVQSAAMGAGAVKRSPLIPPEVRDFAKAKAENADPSSEYDKARKQADLERGLSSLTQNVHAGLDTATRMKTEGYGNAMAEDADRVDSQVAQAKEYALKKLGLDRQARQDALDEEMKRAQMDRMAAEAEKDRRGPEAKPRDPLADAKTQAEIDEIKARTAATQRRGSGGGAGGGGAAAPKGDPLGVPGFTRAPGAPGIKPEEAAEMRKAIEAQAAIEPAIKEMETAKDKTGREYSFGGLGEGPDYAAQSAPYSKMVLGIKELAKSGALDEQSERVAQGMVPVMGDSKAVADKKIASLREYVQSKVDAKAQSLGYVRGSAAAAAPQPPFPGAKRIRRSDGKMGWWDGQSPLPEGVEVVNG